MRQLLWLVNSSREMHDWKVQLEMMGNHDDGFEPPDGFAF